MKESHGTEHRREVNRPVSSTTSEFLRPLFDFMNFEVKLTVDEVVDWLSLRLPEWSVTRNFIISTSISNTSRSVENFTRKFLQKPHPTKIWCAVFPEWFFYNERDEWRLCYHNLTTSSTYFTRRKISLINLKEDQSWVIIIQRLKIIGIKILQFG